MIHMRPFNDFETRNLKFLVDRQVECATIQVTETGLKKSILDATAPVRAYLKDNGIHDYENQPQGELGKRYVETYILTDTSQIHTRTSLYRPITKKGDPRMWVNKVRGVEFVRPDDIFAIIADQGILYVVNLSLVDISSVCKSPVDTPLKLLADRIRDSKSFVSQEILGLIREHMGDWVISEKLADTGIGRTVESLLGISMNSSKSPDYKSIELKSHRKLAKVRNALFTQVPDWSISRFKNSKDIVSKYGYITPGHSPKTLQVTLSATSPNAQILGLGIDLPQGILEIDEFSLMPETPSTYSKVQDVAAWRLSKLHERLLSKHKETFWIEVETQQIGGKEYFRCTEIEHTKNPLPAQFDMLLEQGGITVDLMLCRPSGNGDTYSFKITRKARQLLFPESERYIIQ